MGLDRKGIYYVLFMSFMSAVILVVFLLMNGVRLEDTMGSVSDKAHSLSDFISDFEEDAERATYISGFRALIAMEEEVSQSGEYLNNSEDVFREAFHFGTIDGINITVMENSSFSQYIDRVRYNVERMGMNFTVNVTRIYLRQEDPWNILVASQIELELSDFKNTMRWETHKNYTAKVPIQDIIDPLYAVGTGNLIPNTIRITNITEFVDDTDNRNDTTQLLQFYNTSAYRASTQAPSILMRFEGNLNASEFGIESLVNLGELATQSIPIRAGRSVVDYVYFGTQSTTNLCNIQNTPPGFIIDQDHIEAYEIDELAYTACS
ncbi:MAG: hypothetical protein HC945_01120 [Nitrosarchaeum sp.]|nr:hypothetical protein [Nitrosarchaeum sp.]